MNAAVLVALSLLTSVAGVVYLCLTDSKRQRAHGAGQVKTLSTNKKALVWLLVFAPGALLTGLAQYPALILWFAALPVVGWWVVLLLPAGERAR